jgi:transposase
MMPGKIIAEKKVPTSLEVIASWLSKNAPGLVRVGMETGPLAVWLWNELHDKELPIICLDSRHANAALKVRAKPTATMPQVLLRSCEQAGSSRSRSSHVPVMSYDHY